MTVHPPPEQGRPRRSSAKLLGIGLLSVFSVGLAVATTYQLLAPTLYSDDVTTQYSCRSGTIALLDSVEQARMKATAKPLSEHESLRVFRASVRPVWRQALAIKELCKEDRDQEALKAFKAVHSLRYAEERAVRYTAIDLTKRRETAPRLVSALSLSEATSSHSSPSSSKEKN